jgi:hypothetical protein
MKGAVALAATRRSSSRMGIGRPPCRRPVEQRAESQRLADQTDQNDILIA